MRPLEEEGADGIVSSARYLRVKILYTSTRVIDALHDEQYFDSCPSPVTFGYRIPLTTAITTRPSTNRIRKVGIDASAHFTASRRRRFG
jgi:hypothetical protein